MVYVAAAALGDETSLRAWVQRGVTYVHAHPRDAKPKAKSRRAR
jgi:hypothetical protein